MRDASNCNPFFARSVQGGDSKSRKRSTSTIRATDDENVYYRHNEGSVVGAHGLGRWAQHGTFGSEVGKFRNDLAGGSGVGAGNYNMICDYNDNPGVRGRGSRTAPASRNSRSSSRSKGGKKVRSRYGWGGRRGRGGGKSRRGRGGGAGVVLESGVDPLLQHVGGADINF